MNQAARAQRGKPTIRDVASAAGVSAATVSRVINHAAGASPSIRTRVRAVAAELGYQPSSTARALATGRTRTIEMIVTDSCTSGWIGAHPHYGRVLAGVMSALEGTGTQLRIHALTPDRAAAAIDALAADATVGALLANVTPELATRYYLRCRRVISLVPTAPAVPALEVDNLGAVRTAVSHLHRIGRRRIAAIHGPVTNSCAAQRRDGYRNAITDLGLPELGADGGFCRDGGHDAARELLERHPEIDAMFVACDLMAAGAIQAITATGLRVPEDVAVIGFDDSLAAICTNPPLSTMRLPVEQMAADATRILMDGDPGFGFRRFYPVDLVLRESAPERGPAHTLRAPR
ncbi:LacI family DNA-binding transcriptional regulator [Actinospica robiniae]|uniref:LacI family DNA-binding transcriptional regulator n=1 Tax=Actinospica robiniae TaxID=304901 RepID=UPI000419CCD0|nr:LacI family DNA-binding transcriptional regulator [Actinospica robiniae]